MAVLAHPDDETFGVGGTLAYYAQRGVHTYLICATRGEAGSMNEDCLEGYSSVAARRESELRCALEVLGVKEVYFLDYRDSGMPGSPDNQHPNALINAPQREVAEKIAHLIRQIRPQVLITFDPIGGYKHPDHIAVHRATVEAFYLAADESFIDGLPPYQPAKLYFHLIPKRFLKAAIRVLRLFGKDPRRVGKNRDIDLVALVEEGDFPVHARIRYGSVYGKKQTASRCHESQLDGALMSNPIARLFNRLFSSSDYYLRAYPPLSPRRLETDLFEGVELDS
ncbi:MAG: PIG-L family deacetylase [Anaerolineales bacterium]|nr:PIG-L family deacetylase [Anaerolineales bacterium]MDW8161381.1 PIG-L family deacetylase [Anaerolineales bacterium]